MTVPVPVRRTEFRQWAPDAAALAVLGDKWTLLIVRELAHGPRRFVDIQRGLQQISTESLRTRLNYMVTDGLLTRQRYREVPPRVDYELTEKGRDALALVHAAAQWGYRWAWWYPDGNSPINLASLFQLGASLWRPRRDALGILRLAVLPSGASPPEYYVIKLTSKGAEFRVGGSPPGQTITTKRTRYASVEGDKDAWVAALGPERHGAGLKYRGQRPLARAFLDLVATGRQG